MRRVKLLCALLLTATACETRIEVGPLSPAPGGIVVLDPGGPEGQTGWWPSVTFDAQDVPHVSYCDAAHGDLRYATRKGASWQLEAAVSRGRVGKYTALAVDSQGRPAIAFYDQDHKYLRYAWRTGEGAWETERIAWGLEVGMGAELRFDEGDVPHLFYYVPSGKLVHASKRPGEPEWHKEVIAEATGGFSVRISPVLRPGGFWVSFVHWNFKDTSLMLARKQGARIDVEPVAGRRGPGWRSQLLIEHDQPTILYSQNFDDGLRLARRHDGKWRTSTLLNAVSNFAASRAAGGETVVAYEDVERSAAGNGTVKLLRQSGGAWRRFDVDAEGPAGLYLALATDSKGRALVAYYSDVIRGIKVYDEQTTGSTSR